MKFINFSIASFALLHLASAQPHKGPRHGHAAVHRKREVEVLVYVDSAGKPISTTLATITVPSSISSSSSRSSSSSIAPTTTPVPAPAPVANPAPAAPEAPASSAAPASDSSSSSSSSTSPSAYGLSYSPYNADGSCKTQADVNTDFADFGPSYTGGLVRTYGTDCDQTALVLSAAKPYNMKLFAGIYYLNDIAKEVALMQSAANGDWSGFDTISMGNELVNSGTADASTVVTAISTARSLLRAAGYTGPVVTVDTLVAMRSNPTLGTASDYIAANCHPFFDGTTEPSEAGNFLTTQIATLQTAINDPSKKIVITETGWPTQGSTNGVAVPSKLNQETALTAIKSTFVGNPGGVVILAPYNDLWKVSSAAQFNAEQYWGFLGDAPSG